MPSTIVFGPAYGPLPTSLWSKWKYFEYFEIISISYLCLLVCPFPSIETADVDVTCTHKLKLVFYVITITTILVKLLKVVWDYVTLFVFSYICLYSNYVIRRGRRRGL